MKKYIIAIVALMSSFITSANAMSYEQARTQALFLTDKMAYELNLNEMQYEAVYEINLDYLLSVNTYDDVYARCWTIRNADLRYILLDWQYSAFCAATYFYRPIWWEGGFWHFGIYARYPHRDYLYFGHPHFYATYCGGHSWHMNGGRSWYHGRDFGTRNHGNFSGMRDGWNRGNYRGGRGTGSRNHNDAPRGAGFDNNRGNTRGDVQHGASRNNDRSNSGNFSGRRGNSSSSVRESSTRSTITRQGNDTYGRGTTTNPTRSYSGSSSSTRPSDSFSGNRTSTPSRSYSGGSSSSSSRSSSSFSGGSSSRSSRSISGGGSSSSSSRSSGSTRSYSGGGSSHGSSSSHGSFGGRR